MTTQSTHLRNVCFIAVAAALLLLPLVAWISGVKAGQGVEEKRAKKTLSYVMQGSTRGWTERFEQFFNDNFGLRDLFVAGHNTLDYRFLRSNAKVIVGTDGWLFLERGLNAKMPPVVDDLCGRLPFKDTELDYWHNQFVHNWRWLKDTGRQYFLLVVPNKHTLYRQYLPSHLRCNPSNTRRHAITDRLTKDPDFPYIDLYPTLAAASASSPAVYHRTDTHWNRIGVYLAYEQLLSAVNQQRQAGSPAITGILKTDQLAIVSKDSSAGDLAQMLGLGNEISETMEGFRIRRSFAKLRRDPLPGHSDDPYRQPVAFVNPSRDALPRILVFHDSFIGKRVQLLLAETFSHATFVWNSGPDIPFHIIDKVKPDIVIHEMVERSLLQTIPDEQLARLPDENATQPGNQ